MFAWIWNLQKQVSKYGSISALINRLKGLGINDVCIKYHEGSGFVGGGVNYKADFMKYVKDLKNSGFRVGTWGYNHFNHIEEEVNCIKDALLNSDYYVYDPEVDVANKFQQAQSVCSSVRTAYPKALIGYASFPIVSYHQDIPYSVFDRYCDFASPQAYWGEMQWDVSKCLDKMLNDHKSYGLNKPIYPSIQTYNVSYNDLLTYLGYKFKYTGLWDFDEIDSTFIDFLKNRSSQLNAQESIFSSYEVDFIKSVQHDLQRVSCLKNGEMNVTGKLDDITKAAIKQFRYIVGLSGGDNLDINLVVALNAIVKKPTIGKGWAVNLVATKFIQWWIGMSRNGIFDDIMTQKVKEWQLNNKIWGNPDGIIREKDWNKILK